MPPLTLHKFIARAEDIDVFCLESDQSVCHGYSAAKAMPPAWMIIVPVLAALIILGLIIIYSIKYRRRYKKKMNASGPGYSNSGTPSQMMSNPVYMQNWVGTEIGRQQPTNSNPDGPPPTYQTRTGGKNGFQRLNS